MNDRKDNQEFIPHFSVEPVRQKPKKPESLPASEDEEFWGDAETQKVNLKEVEKPKMDGPHQWLSEGVYEVCQSCPFAHTKVLANPPLDKRQV